jgi:hypothetical protein
MKKIAILTIFLMVVFMSAMIAPTYAAAPTTIEDVWFVIPVFVSSTPSGGPITFTADKVWTSDDGTVLHSRSTTIATYIARSPQGAPGTVRIGTTTAVSDFVFDTVSSTGTLNMKITITLATSTNPQYPNPYGIGTLEGTLTAEVTSLNPYVPVDVCPLPGNGQGYLVATHGTGAFENAKLTADVTLSPGIANTLATPTSPARTLFIEYLFVGHHTTHLYNDGTLTLHHPGSSK